MIQISSWCANTRVTALRGNHLKHLYENPDGNLTSEDYRHYKRRSQHIKRRKYGNGKNTPRSWKSIVTLFDVLCLLTHTPMHTTAFWDSGTGLSSAWNKPTILEEKLSQQLTKRHRITYKRLNSRTWKQQSPSSHSELCCESLWFIGHCW